MEARMEGKKNFKINKILNLSKVTKLKNEIVNQSFRPKKNYGV